MSQIRRFATLTIALIPLVVLSLAVAQGATTFGDTFGEVPVDRSTTDAINGSGTLSATLDGNMLTIEGTFEGINSNATAAHIHQGQFAPGVSGPPIIDLTVTNATSGDVSGAVELTDDQVDLLQQGLLYVQIHSEDNPGGVLRAWLWPR